MNSEAEGVQEAEGNESLLMQIKIIKKQILMAPRSFGKMEICFGHLLRDGSDGPDSRLGRHRNAWLSW
jgi:hypothetical protein